MAGSVLLIVPRDASDRTRFNQFLVSTTHHLVYAKDGEEAFDRFLEVKPTLVIVPMMMAQLDATLLIPLLRQQFAGDIVPMIIISDRDEPADEARRRVKSIGADASLPTTFDRSRLIEALTPLLAHGRGERTEQQSPADSVSSDIDWKGKSDDLLGAITDEKNEAMDTVVGIQNPYAEALPLIRELSPLREDSAPKTDRAPASVPQIPDHSNFDDKAHLIEEPVLSRSNTDTRIPIETGQSKREGAQRRGLDESQLGRRLAKRIRSMWMLLEKVDHHQLLGIDRDAKKEVIDRAYFDLSLEFHPDRFFLLKSGDLKEKIYAIYRRVDEAYAAIASAQESVGSKIDADAALTGESERTVEGRLIEVDVEHPKAARLIDYARVAVMNEDLNAARLHLSLALIYEANNVPLKAMIDRIARWDAEKGARRGRDSNP